MLGRLREEIMKLHAALEEMRKASLSMKDRAGLIPLPRKLGIDPAHEAPDPLKPTMLSRAERPEDWKAVHAAISQPSSTC